MVGTRMQVHILNSWGDKWGNKGTGWFWFDQYPIDEIITLVDLPNNVDQQLNELPPATQFKHRFSTPLAKGVRGDEVVKLQTALMIDGVFSSALYADLLKTGELGYYGVTTAKAVMDYQLKHQLDSVAVLSTLKGESFGPKTRAHMNSWTNK